MFPSQHADLGRGAIPETVLNSRENVGSGDRTWVLGCGCTWTGTIDTMAAAMGYGGNVDHLPSMQAAWTRNAEIEARERLRIEYRQAHGGVEPPPMAAPAKRDRKANELLGSANLQNLNYIPVGQYTTNDDTMFKFGNKEKKKKASGFSGVGDNASWSFGVAEDATAREGETLQQYAARHGDIPLTTTPLTTIPLGNAHVLGDSASTKYEGILRSEDDENDEPQWAISDSQHNDGISSTIFVPAPSQNANIFNLAPSQNNTTANMPPKVTIKLKSTTTEAYEAQEAANKAMKHKLPTAHEIRRDMPPPMTGWPDRPATQNGGDEYQETLHAKPRMAEKYRMFGDDIEAMHLAFNVPVYNEAGYEIPGTPETPGKWVEEEWENRTRFGDPQPINYWTAPPGAAMKWRTNVGVDASGRDVDSEDPPAMNNVQDAKFEEIGAKAASAPKGKMEVGINPQGWITYVDTEDGMSTGKEVEAGTSCGMDNTKTCNHALCKSKTVAQTLIWSPFSTQAGLATNSAQSRDTIEPGWFSHLAGIPEGTETVFDTSAPGVQGADQAARVATMTMDEDEKIVKEAADKIAKEIADAAAEETKVKKKHTLLMIKEKKERERKEAEKERQQAEKKRLDAERELRRLEEELAGL